MDTLNLDKIKNLLNLVICTLIFSCCLNNDSDDNIEKSNLIKRVSIEKIGSIKNYNQFYTAMSDTINNWIQNELIPVKVIDDFEHKPIRYQYKIDSVYCVNSNVDKIFGCLFQTGSSEIVIKMDDVIEFYGAKIAGKWYFWKGGTQPVLRKPFKGHNPKKPLSYAQLHSQAIDWMGGYLKKDGSINDEWFEFMFKQGFSGKNTFRDRYLTRNRLNGHKIDTEKEFWDYTFKKLGLGLWIGRSTNDSISKYNTLNPNNKLSNEQETEICNYITQRYMNMPEKLKLK